MAQGLSPPPSEIPAPVARSSGFTRGVQEGGPGGVGERGGKRGHHEALRTAILRDNPVGLVASNWT